MCLTSAVKLSRHWDRSPYCLLHEAAVRQHRQAPAQPWKGLSATGIDKRPVDGPVAVTAPGPKGTGAVGLAGDRVYDAKHHGSSDQAVNAYAREDLDGWQTELDRPLANGVSGENLTTLGVDVNGALIGERWRIGSKVVLEVSCARIPCATFQGWLERDGWIKRFTQAALPGVRPGKGVRALKRAGRPAALRTP
ncbi:MOSC domain-containing protein [Nonomuraea sp. NPDC050153]|uniref:MOSC domain-containing protein n=1 Tax=Nonomuraea sp. NPDC050153 TaxID=3364359 RepID=UPI0037BA195E